MQEGIHPEYKEIHVKCSCGNEFNTFSAMSNNALTIEVCNQCHPFYTGKMKVIDNAGRVSDFYRKFGKINDQADSKAE